MATRKVVSFVVFDLDYIFGPAADPGDDQTEYVHLSLDEPVLHPGHESLNLNEPVFLLELEKALDELVHEQAAFLRDQAVDQTWEAFRRDQAVE